MKSLKGIQPVKILKQLVNPRIPQPIEGILPLVDGTSIEEENSDADEDQVVLDEDSELLKKCTLWKTTVNASEAIRMTCQCK